MADTEGRAEPASGEMDAEDAGEQGIGGIVGLGHDLQWVRELEGRDGLREPGVLFSASELEGALEGPESLRNLAVLFSVKEAFFKALPVQSSWFWPELQLTRSERGRPMLRFEGALLNLMLNKAWSAHVSISHSGEYVSSVVLITRR